jgi:hypothetical protein
MAENRDQKKAFHGWEPTPAALLGQEEEAEMPENPFQCGSEKAIPSLFRDMIVE